MTPPLPTNPYPGQAVPTGDQCRRCRALTRFWVYNPFTRASLPQRGWLLAGWTRCRCPEGSA